MNRNKVWTEKAFIEDRQAMGEVVHVLFDGVTYTGTISVTGVAVAFADELPDGACELLHEYFGVKQ
jgi:hypothetical protein